MHRLLIIVLFVGIIAAEVSNGPLVYPSWPPKSSQPKPMTYHQIQNLPAQQNRLQSMYQMRSNPPVSKYPSSTFVQSPSNMVHSYTKHRPYQMHTMPPQKQQTQTQPQPKRIVMRPQSPKIHHPSISGNANSYIMSSIKPYHTSSHPIGAESHNIYFKQPQNSPQIGKPTYSGLKTAHKTVDYVFENPFGNDIASLPTMSALKSNHLVMPSTSTLPVGGQTQIQHYRLQNAFNTQPQFQQHTKPKYNPIHTINAPDLTLLEQKPLGNFINRPIEVNHISEKDIAGAYNPQRPYSIHQYQVTEPSNDHTLRENHAGQQNIYVPHPETSQGSYHIQQAPDSFNTPNFSQGFNYQPAASALVQHQVFPSYSNTAQTNNGPISNFQDTKQHIVYHHQPEMPMAAYNPTYLVTQSNQLLSQHKQHLFKPDPLFVQHQSHKSGPQPESEFIPSYQLEQHSTPDPIGHYQNQQISQPLDEPQFARLIGADPNQQPIQQQQQHQMQQPLGQSPSFYQTKQKHSSVLQHRPALTENEMSNLLNFGRLDGDSSPNQNNAAGFVASSFMQTEPINTSSGSVLYTNPSYESVLQHQQQNNDRIVEATRQAMNSQKQMSHHHHHQQQQGKPSVNKKHTIFVTKSPDQKRQDDVEAQHKENTNKISSDLRIYVPDSSEYTANNSETFQKRSDNFGNEHEQNTTTGFENGTQADVLQTTTDSSLDAGNTIAGPVSDDDPNADHQRNSIQYQESSLT